MVNPRDEGDSLVYLKSLDFTTQESPSSTRWGGSKSGCNNSVGYRINSKNATQFRIWATKTLKEYIVKGFVLDDELLKNGTRFGKDYFDELLENIRDIRTSERRFYQKITDIFAECSYDYASNSEITKNFYSKVQNNCILP